MGKLEGKIALITGGNGGIGFATAKRFVNEGAYVFITGRRKPETAAAVEEIGRNVIGVQGDVSNLGDLDRLFAQIKQEKGRLDIVFANAGIVKLAPLGTITEESYDSVFNINVKGVLFTVQKALPLLPDGASIILNASIGASKGPPANSVNCATKAAVRSFARTLTTDLKDRRIRVNAVSPGVIETPGLEGVMGSSETGRQLGQMISGATPLGRFGTPDEIAKAVVFLASDDSSYITGTELSVEGGEARLICHHQCVRYCAKGMADDLDRLALQGRSHQSRSDPQLRARGPRDSREHAKPRPDGHGDVRSLPRGDAVKDILRTNNPSKRIADPLEIAKLAVYLASDDSAYVVGADFLIDGGVSAISAVGA